MGEVHKKSVDGDEYDDEIIQETPDVDSPDASMASEIIAMDSRKRHAETASQSEKRVKLVEPLQGSPDMFDTDDIDFDFKPDGFEPANPFSQPFSMYSEGKRREIENIIAMLQSQATQTQTETQIQPQQQQQQQEQPQESQELQQHQSQEKEEQPENVSQISLHQKSVDELLETVSSAHDRINKLIDKVKESSAIAQVALQTFLEHSRFDCKMKSIQKKQ